MEMTQQLSTQELKNIFQGYPFVVAAYLFGSRVSGRVTSDSDVDIAILLTEDAPRGRELVHEEDYMAYRIAKALNVKEVDLIDLNGKGLIFQHNVLRTGKLIYERDPNVRIRFESYVITRFCDFEPTIRYIERFQLSSRIKRYRRS